MPDKGDSVVDTTPLPILTGGDAASVTKLKYASFVKNMENFLSRQVIIYVV